MIFVDAALRMKGDVVVAFRGGGGIAKGCPPMQIEEMATPGQQERR